MAGPPRWGASCRAIRRQDFLGLGAWPPPLIVHLRSPLSERRGADVRNPSAMLTT